MKKPKFPNLAAEMARQGYTTEDIASQIGMNLGVFRSRLYGQTDFKLPEMVKIRDVIDNRFITSIDYLFVKGTEYDKPKHYEACEE